MLVQVLWLSGAWGNDVFWNSTTRVIKFNVTRLWHSLNYNNLKITNCEFIENFMSSEMNN